MKLTVYTCRRCGNRWIPRTQRPAKCPECGSAKWDSKRRPGELGRKPLTRNQG